MREVLCHEGVCYLDKTNVPTSVSKDLGISDSFKSSNYDEILPMKVTSSKTKRKKTARKGSPVKKAKHTKVVQTGKGRKKTRKPVIKFVKRQVGSGSKRKKTKPVQARKAKKPSKGKVRKSRKRPTQSRKLKRKTTAKQVKSTLKKSRKRRT